MLVPSALFCSRLATHDARKPRNVEASHSGNWSNWKDWSTGRRATPGTRVSRSRSTTTTTQLAIHITINEADLIAAEPGGFVSQALALVYREVYRVFETFLIDLFEEIALRDIPAPRQL